MSPFDPSKNKPLTAAWWREMVLRFIGFEKQGAIELSRDVSKLRSK